MLNMQTEEDYKKEWERGLHQSEYNSCRFADDKLSFATNWLFKKVKKLNLENPQNIVDLICKQKLRIITDNEYCQQCQNWADKCYAQDLLYNKNLGQYSIQTNYIKPNNDIINESDIINTLNQINSDIVFLKCNHSSGWNLRIDKNNLSSSKYIADKLTEWCHLNYAYISGYEKQYEKIKPVILVQPELIYRPLDYGFWCVNGKIEGISLTKKLSKNLEEYIAFVNKNGLANDWFIGLKPSWDNLPKSFKERIDEMIPIVETLANGFDFVRVDMYYINNKIYFGEMTFTPCSGVLELSYR